MFIAGCGADSIGDSLIQEWHGVECGRLDEGQVAIERFACFRNDELRATVDPGVEVARTGVDMAERQDAKAKLFANLAEGIDQGRGIRRQVGVAEHDAAGAASGAGGVEDGGEGRGWGVGTGVWGKSPGGAGG